MEGKEIEGKNVRVWEITNGRYREMRRDSLDIIRALLTVCKEVEIKIKNGQEIDVSAYRCEVNRVPEWWEKE